MTDFDFFELGDPDNNAGNKTSKEDTSKLPKLNHQESNYQQDFDAFEQSLKKSKVKAQEKLADHLNTKSVSNRRLLNKLKKDKRSESTTLPHKSLVERERYASVQEELPTKYTSQVTAQFPELQYDGLTDKQVNEEIERVRTTIKNFNTDLNAIMERNQGYVYKKDKQQPQQKPVEQAIKTLVLVRENNLKQLELMEVDRKTLEKKAHNYTFKQGVDPIAELNEKILNTHTQIDKCKKFLKAAQVDIERASKSIKETTDAAADETANYKKFNEMRTQSVYLAKKNQEFQQREKQLTKNISEMQSKEDDLNIKYEASKKTAQDKYLEVTSNKTFIQTKKKFLQLKINEDNIKKIIENNKRRTKYYEQVYEKQFLELRKQLQKIQQAQNIKESEISVINRQIKSQVEKCSSQKQRALKLILSKFSSQEQDNIPKPAPIKKNYIETSSTLRNMDLEPLVYNGRQANKNQRSSSHSQPQNKETPQKSIFKPALPKRKEIALDDQPKERQWKEDKVINSSFAKVAQRQPPSLQVDFALDKPKEQKQVKEEKNFKPMFKINRKKNEPDNHAAHNVSMPIISDTKKNEKEQSTLQPKAQPEQVINARPKLFRQIKRSEQSNINYSPEGSGIASKNQQKIKQLPTSNDFLLPTSRNDSFPEKQETTPIMLRPFERRKRIQSIEKDLPVKPIEAPVKLEPVNDKNPFMKDYSEKQKLKLDRPAKIKIEKQQPKQKKYDIYAADEILVNDIQQNKSPEQPTMNLNANNRQLTLLELLGNEKPNTKEDDYQFPSTRLKEESKLKDKKTKQIDFFDGMDL